MTISIITLAWILLLAHTASGCFIGAVIRKQIGLIRRPLKAADLNDYATVREVKHFRAVLLTLSSIIFLGNLAPILIDGVTILSNNATGRPGHVRTISIVYAVSNALTALISAYLVWRLYRLAAEGAVVNAETADPRNLE